LFKACCFKRSLILTQYHPQFNTLTEKSGPSNRPSDGHFKLNPDGCNFLHTRKIPSSRSLLHPHVADFSTPRNHRGYCLTLLSLFTLILLLFSWFGRER
jgi:hypothetical protein